MTIFLVHQLHILFHNMSNILWKYEIKIFKSLETNPETIRHGYNSSICFYNYSAIFQLIFSQCSFLVILSPTAHPVLTEVGHARVM